MTIPSKKPDGLRERKRRETLARIAETGLKLFIKNGYEATTLDAIAEAAGISRRTFFYYFKSKDDVLMAGQGSGFVEAMRAAMLEESPDQAPLDVVRKCFLKLASRYETKESIVVDQLLRSNEVLRARKEADFVEKEKLLVAAMSELWPAPAKAKQDALRLVAMMAMGTLRLAIDNWRQENAKRSLTHYLDKSFALLESQF
jgi:AcrR family transcriptional regulator